MFSSKQKQQIAEAVENIILSFNHPEMPVSKPKFKLHIDGKESWSYADIEPNWVFTENNKRNCSWCRRIDRRCCDTASASKFNNCTGFVP